MNINLFELITLLGLFLLAYLFWQWRMQEEFARQHAEALCKRHDLQFLDIARASGRPRFQPKTGWEARFIFGFSSDTQSRYEGDIWLLNRHLRDYRLPTYRTATEPSAGDLEAAADNMQANQSKSSAQEQKPTQRVRVSYGIPAPTPEAIKQRSTTPQSDSTSDADGDDIVDAVFKTPESASIEPLDGPAGHHEGGFG